MIFRVMAASVWNSPAWNVIVIKLSFIKTDEQNRNVSANPDMDPGSLSKISNDTNVIAILRSVPQDPSFRDSTKGQGEHEGTTEEGEIEEETEDKSDSQWLIPERLPNTFQTDLVVSFIQDAITIAATATASKENSYRTEVSFIDRAYSKTFWLNNLKSKKRQTQG